MLKRRYIRHPSNTPIECSIPNTPLEKQQEIRNVSKSGLCFTSTSRANPGTHINLKIPFNNAHFEVTGIVMWCHDIDDHSEIGVKFVDDKTEFSVRMIEQLCHIEQYRQQVLKNENRKLSSEAACREWIENFAGDFPE